MQKTVKTAMNIKATIRGAKGMIPSDDNDDASQQKSKQSSTSPKIIQQLLVTRSCK